VEAFAAEGVEGAQIEAAKDLERQQCGQSLTIGWTLPDAKAPVDGADRLVPGRGVARQVFLGEHAAVRAHHAYDGPGHLAPVEALLAFFHHAAKCAGEGRVAKDLPGVRAAPFDHELPPTR
jgi:hypothetical protein